MPQRFRESLALLLIILLPFHAFLVTVVTKMILGPGHAPMTMVALWKEALLGVILCLCLFEYIRDRWGNGFDKLTIKRTRAAMDGIDWLIAGLIVLSLIVTAMTHGDWKLYAFGFKYDFISLIAFLILRRVTWSDACKSRAMHLLLMVGGIIAGYGILTFFLPQDFFTALGYSDLHSLYLPDAPLAAFQQIEALGLRRIQSVMSGPNQLGLWLLIPWSIVCLHPPFGPEGLRASNGLPLLRGRRGVLAGLIAVAILLTFSRSAWIAAGVILLVVLWRNVPRKAFKIILMQLLFLGAVFTSMTAILAPQLILRQASSGDHLRRPLEAIQMMIAHPLGLGLGSAGPASNRVSDACVHLPAGSDASWAKDRPNLCVFVDDIQIQPVDRACHCPSLPENWYLQIGVELGILGMALYLILIIAVMRWLAASGKRQKDSAYRPFGPEGLRASNGLSLIALLSFLGISIAALFLHAWEDAAVAYTVWFLVACNGFSTPRRLF